MPSKGKSPKGAVFAKAKGKARRELIEPPKGAVVSFALLSLLLFPSSAVYTAEVGNLNYLSLLSCPEGATFAFAFAKTKAKGPRGAPSGGAGLKKKKFKEGKTITIKFRT